MDELNDLYKLTEYTPSDLAVEHFQRTFLQFESDKAGFHTYELIYSALFPNLIDVRNVLELGIHRGGSLRSWKHLFPNAQIIGLELLAENFLTEERITSVFVDQRRPETFHSFYELFPGKKFNMVVDDGCHELEPSKLTFQKLLPMVALGGYYVLEDIRAEHESEWQGLAEELNVSIGYKAVIVNMRDLAETPMKDNIVMVVKHV